MSTIDAPTRPTDLLGKGLYTQTEAAEIISLRLPGIKRQTLSNWAFGRADNDHHLDQVFVPELNLPPGERILTFLDLVELHFIAMFRRNGVSLRVIRAAAKRAADQFGSHHPFAVKRFGTDGKTIFAMLADDQSVRAGASRGELVEDLNRAQMVIGSIAQPFLRSIEYDYEALQYWPLNRNQGIILDPNRQFGKPIIASAGIPTRIIYQIAQNGESIENIADWYDVLVDEVLAAIELENRLNDVPLRQ